jgi:hypothetical protein
MLILWQLDSADSDYASSGYDTSSTSLSSSVFEYVFENGAYAHYWAVMQPILILIQGRRYHAYFGTDKNFLPTDEREQDRWAPRRSWRN